MSAFLERAIDVSANDVTRAQAKINAAKRGEKLVAEVESKTKARVRPVKMVRAKR